MASFYQMFQQFQDYTYETFRTYYLQQVFSLYRYKAVLACPLCGHVHCVGMSTVWACPLCGHVHCVGMSTVEIKVVVKVNFQ